MTIFVTGGAGFIGSNFVRCWLERVPTHKVGRIIVIDKLTYAGNKNSLSDSLSSGRVDFIHGDIGDLQLIPLLLNQYNPCAIINFAAETHVDRSIDSPDCFIQANIVATSHLLKSTYDWWNGLSEMQKNSFRFIHVSTDEVYGALSALDPPFTEDHPYKPNNPYSASKAASDHMVRAYYHTYGLPALTTNCSNNYGPYQFFEKLIPSMISRALKNQSLPIYGDGLHIRDWIYVTDHCQAICDILDRGRVGEAYNIGGSCEMKNIDVVRMICDILDEKHPRTDGKSYQVLISYIADRKGHDYRYAINHSKITRDTGWTPRHDFYTGLEKTVEWYLRHASHNR